MPTLATMVADIRQNILDPTTDYAGNPVTPRYTDAQILLKVNVAAAEVARKSLCVTDHQNVATVLGTQEYNLPSNFIQLRSVMYRSGAGNTPVRLQEVALEETFNDSEFSPTGYARRGTNVLRLDAPPEAAIADGLIIDYYRLPTEVTGTGDALDVPERYRDAVVYRTSALILAGADEEPTKASDFQALYVEAVQEAVDREREASHTAPGKVRDTYDPYTGGFYF